MNSMSSSRPPLRYDLHVPPDGRIEVQLPLPISPHITVYVVENIDDSTGDLLNASNSAIDFWDNPEDDEDWNDA